MCAGRCGWHPRTTRPWSRPHAKHHERRIPNACYGNHRLGYHTGPFRRRGAFGVCPNLREVTSRRVAPTGRASLGRSVRPFPHDRPPCSPKPQPATASPSTPQGRAMPNGRRVTPSPLPSARTASAGSLGASASPLSFSAYGWLAGARSTARHWRRSGESSRSVSQQSPHDHRKVRDRCPRRPTPTNRSDFDPIG